VGVAILSRWPVAETKIQVVPRFYRVLKFRPRLALGVTTIAPSGPIRIWTTHLDTRIPVEERLKQLRPILAEADQYQGPSIIGGDFNTLGLNWLLHTVPYPIGKAHARAVTELMERHGFETPFKGTDPTFDLFGMQLDWLFFRGLDAVRTGIQPLEVSDHHAIWTEFVDQRKPQVTSMKAADQSRDYRRSASTTRR
jgi:endonuclease/exonuclease/phosphatase family metal-dependent hydrolase